MQTMKPMFVEVQFLPSSLAVLTALRDSKTCRGSGARDETRGSSTRPIRPIEAPRSSTQPPKRRPCTTWWLGRSLPNLATHVAIFARNRVSARNADHTLTDIPWATAAAFCLRSSKVIRTTIPNTAVARSARNGAKKGCRVSFFMVLGRFLGETGSVCRRVC